jgi:hypothetical protein
MVDKVCRGGVIWTWAMIVLIAGVLAFHGRQTRQRLDYLESREKAHGKVLDNAIMFFEQQDERQKQLLKNAGEIRKEIDRKTEQLKRENDKKAKGLEAGKHVGH